MENDPDIIVYLCNCEEGEIGRKWIRQCEDLAIAHGYKYKDGNRAWKYCAWCGKPLKERI